MVNPNLSASLNIFRLILNPSLCLPHATISTFKDLPVPVSKVFAQATSSSNASGEKPASPSTDLQDCASNRPDIRAVILDKDNCFAKDGEEVVWEDFKETFSALQTAYPSSKLLIVSNSAGTPTADASDSQAQAVERATGVTVLRHATKKPGCGPEILEYLYKAPDSGVTRPNQVAIVGDRLFTDVMMANMMGSWAVWCWDGIGGEAGRGGVLSRFERRLAKYLFRVGYKPPNPVSPFE
ncbi:hypothetical protein MMC25_002624, partial [Agyrium rufum]|nr:hypothetical protein [Agyrium rufum]